ncbi:HEAT repeat domain-containing protein [Geoalkalibacter sp.]|uniref:HEAT repeat domain-containing protein n=1 Tax=Geoalkalibacter sp. TaxID=3041440 RepID=UPI00272E0132|nr:HEAT repeat domain-containing protein [Geoalkalibacter sp.]
METRLHELAQIVEAQAPRTVPPASELIRRGAADIARLHMDPRIEPLIERLGNAGDWAGQLEAWEEIRELGPHLSGWESALCHLIHQGEGWARIFAAESLACHARAETQAVPVLLATLAAALRLGQHDWARMACGALGRFTNLAHPLIQRAVPALKDALSAEDLDVQAYAALALGNYGPQAHAALVRLAELWERAPEGLARHFAAVVGQIAPEADSPFLARLEALHDPCESTRAEAVAALGRRRREIAPALDRLLPLAGDESPDVRRNLALALGELPHPDEQARVRLAHLCRDGDTQVRLAAAYASIRQGEDVAAQAARLRGALRDNCRESRRLAAWALGETAQTSPWRTRKALNQALGRETDPATRQVLEQALAKLA